MTTFDNVPTAAKAHDSFGGERDTSCADAVRLNVRPSTPGHPGGGTNPQQLLPADWPACFLSAIKRIAGKRKVVLPAAVAIDIEINLCTTRGSFGLAPRLFVTLPGLDRKVARALVGEAYRACPYSRGTRGSIDVVLNGHP